MTGSAECFVAKGIECFVAGVAECSVSGGTECFLGTSLVVLSTFHHPNLPDVLLHSCKWGNAVPMNISLQLACALPLCRGLLLLGVGFLLLQWVQVQVFV